MIEPVIQTDLDPLVAPTTPGDFLRRALETKAITFADASTVMAEELEKFSWPVASKPQFLSAGISLRKAAMRLRDLEL